MEDLAVTVTIYQWLGGVCWYMVDGKSSLVSVQASSPMGIAAC